MFSKEARSIIPDKKAKSPRSQIVTLELEGLIYYMRGQKVMLDRDLAGLYDVKTQVLIQAVKRNRARFPDDFMFQLTKNEMKNLISQFVTSSWGGHRKLPYAFTEQGVAMLSSVLRSPQAVAVNIEIMRAFVRLRHVLSSQKEMSKELTELKAFLLRHSHKTDREFMRVWRAIEKLSAPSADKKAKKRGIGFDLS